MTKLFFDTEFTGLHQFTTLISIGIVAETGQTFYCELNDFDRSQVDDWLKQNVIDKLLYNMFDYCTLPASKGSFLGKTDKQELKGLLEKFFSQFESVQIWSDCLSYDWVLFCQIFGHSFSIPKNIQYIPLDICPLLLQKTGDADISREQYAGNEIQNLIDTTMAPIWGLAQQQKHNALWDAYVIRACYNKLHQ